MRIRPRARNPTCACMQRFVPTIDFMWVDHRNPGGYTRRLTRPSPVRRTSSWTPPTSRWSASFMGARSGSVGLISLSCGHYVNCEDGRAVIQPRAPDVRNADDPHVSRRIFDSTDERSNHLSARDQPETPRTVGG